MLIIGVRFVVLYKSKKMNVLFLTMLKTNIEQRYIYSDLMRRFRNEGHEVYIVMPCERREGLPTALKIANGTHTLSVWTLNVQKTNVVEKGLGQVSLELLYKRAIKRYFKGVKFGLILYSTPPIIFTNVIKYVKKQNPGAMTYLMLKDIFPQNAVDIEMLSKTGLKGLLYRSFRKKEKEMYRISDWIGCMSPANVEYLLKHNPEMDAKKVEVCPNSMEPVDEEPQSIEERNVIRETYGLPLDKTIFFYGGNLGKPQGIPFLVECLKANCQRGDCHFIVVGDGTEYSRLDHFIRQHKPANVSLYKRLPKENYDKLANACDVGLLFLDYRFTIPNYPSRLLACLMQKKPIIACTDPNCDTGSIAIENEYGMWAPSDNVEAFTARVNDMLKADIKQMGENGYQFYLNNYTERHTYDAIMKHLCNDFKRI